MKYNHKIAILLTQAFWFDGEKYTTRYPFALYIIAMAKHVKKLVLFVPLKKTNAEHGDFIVDIPDNVIIIPCPYFFSLKQLYLKSFIILPGYLFKFYKHRHLFDVMGLVDTNIVSFLAYVICSFKNIKFFFYLRVNPEKSYPLQYKGFSGLITGHCLAFVEEALCRLMVKKQLIFTIGQELFNKYRKFSRKTFLFYTNLISIRQIRNKIEIDQRHSELKILFVGRFVPQKGLNNLLTALKNLISKGYSAKLNLVGDGACRNELEEFVQKNNLRAYVKFWGNIEWGDNLFEHYIANDVFISPSLTEGFPKTIFEAMSFGAIVVATDVGGISGIVKNQHNGLLIKPDSADDISFCLRQLMNNHGLRMKLSKNAYITAIRYSIENQIKNLLSIINQEI